MQRKVSSASSETGPVEGRFEADLRSEQSAEKPLIKAMMMGQSREDVLLCNQRTNHDLKGK